jgi:hypothetical protein
LSDLAPLPPPQVPEPAPAPAPPAAPPQPEPSGGDGPVELWRRANTATRATLLGTVLVLLLVGSFVLGRQTAPGSGSAADGGAATQADAAPADVPTARRQDETAKRGARDVATFVESCAGLATDRSYAGCRTKAQLNVGSTLPVVDGRAPGAGEVGVTASRSGYSVVSVSESGNSFTIESTGGQPTRTCTDGGVQGAGCAGGVW